MTSGVMIWPQFPQGWHHFPTYIHDKWTAELEDAAWRRATQVVRQALGYHKWLTLLHRWNRGQEQLGLGMQGLCENLFDGRDLHDIKIGRAHV